MQPIISSFLRIEKYYTQIQGIEKSFEKCIKKLKNIFMNKFQNVIPGTVNI